VYTYTVDCICILRSESRKIRLVPDLLERNYCESRQVSIVYFVAHWVRVPQSRVQKGAVLNTEKYCPPERMSVFE
jgi:hypothetical protein